ncbi:Poly-beta-1,6-N-acetyl-D-glucosamine biosynthesis protein PgaD [Bordetella tumbae]
MNAASPERVRQDRRLIGQTLLKLALPRLIVRGVVLVIAAIIWLLVASWLLDFGRSLSFEGLQAFGQQAIDLLTRVNPYLWWGVVVIWSLIVFFAVRAWVASDIDAARAKPVAPRDLSALTAQLCDEVINVLRWVWGNREEPFTLGDLRQAHIELRHGRIDKIDLVREQGNILDGQTAAATRSQPATSAPSAAPAQAAVLTTPAATAETRPASGRIEPNL